ncbi:MAG: 3-methyl-2-oxobutanoate dehydrogenase subunit VorB [Caldilineaceae bacterium]|nr:3-methyl-2-oxobutanoate dehydrogenase subunit VorB [Caldilineaceae bacterium]
MTKELWKGNEAIAEAGVRAGAEAYFGYPITPQTELLEYLAWRMPELGRLFLQAESEIGAIHMVYGAASAGKRAFTSSSSPGISLMQEGLSYIAASEVPCVLVDVMRGGPGLGNIQPSQADYFQMTRSAGHGDYRPLVLAPATVQEAVDLMSVSFDLAFRYRHLVVLLADGILGQMMEPVEMPPMRSVDDPLPDWALSGAAGREPRSITSLYLGAEKLEGLNLRLQAKIAHIQKNEQRWEAYRTGDAETLIVAFGTVGRIARSAVELAREQGRRVGLFRPISLWPFPAQALARLSPGGASILVAEMNAGQMREDVERIVGEPVHFLGRMGGMIPTPEEIVEALPPPPQSPIHSGERNGVAPRHLRESARVKAASQIGDASG